MCGSTELNATVSNKKNTYYNTKLYYLKSIANKNFTLLHCTYVSYIPNLFFLNNLLHTPVRFFSIFYFLYYVWTFYTHFISFVLFPWVVPCLSPFVYYTYPFYHFTRNVCPPPPPRLETQHKHTGLHLSFLLHISSDMLLLPLCVCLFYFDVCAKPRTRRVSGCAKVGAGEENKWKLYISDRCVCFFAACLNVTKNNKAFLFIGWKLMSIGDIGSSLVGRK